VNAPRELSAFDLGCVVTGGIIGVGIFFTPASVAQAVDTEGQVLLAWGLGGLLAALGALVFAELSLRVPGHGGMFRYLEAAFGARVAFLYGWANWLVIQAGALGVVALLLLDNLEAACVGVPRWSPTFKVLAAAAVIVGFTAVNVVGLRTGKRMQNALTVLKVAALAALVALAWVDPAVPANDAPVAASGRSLPAMLAAAMLPVLFAVGGWQQGSFVAGAARTALSVPLGILGGVAVVIVTYMTVNLAYLDLLGFAGARSATAIGAEAARAGLGDVGGRVIAGMVALSAAGILNTICLAPPYVLYAMAQAGLFPSAFGRLHPRLHTPVLGILGQGLWGAALLLLVHFAASLQSKGTTIGTLDFVCNSVVFADWLFFMLCGAALLKLRRSQPTADVRIRAGGAVAAAFALGALAVTIGAILVRPIASLAGGALIALGLAARRWFG
jgi:APA family basic amino acid/polyamine antiporter